METPEMTRKKEPETKAPEDQPPVLGLIANGVGRQPIQCENWNDENGRPAGGYAHGVGFEIQWQNGPTRNEEGRLVPQSGAFIEDVLEAVAQRLEYHQEGEFVSAYNEAALEHVKRAMVALDSRRRDRAARGVDGTHAV
jgi:hypothetical protein